MLTALWRKRCCPDFILLGGISRDSLFLVVMIVNRLVKITYFVDLGKSRKFQLASQKVVRHLNFQRRFHAIIVT